ncbi:MAG: phosphoribosylanthranilate isomerase [Chthoniobacterales bacterium]
MLESDHEVAVKVCGVTSAADALACAEAGVDIIGLNFSPLSVRCILPEAATRIAAPVRARFPRIKFVGIFVNQELEFVRRIALDLPLDAVQLHGEETPDYVREIDLPFVIKALRVGSGRTKVDAGSYSSHAILLDTWSGTSPGGTGETFPWSLAAAVRPQVKYLILAGGLTSENVAAAIRAVRPDAVDACSGAEAAPGQKDREKVRKFVENVRAVEGLDPSR